MLHVLSVLKALGSVCVCVCVCMCACVCVCVCVCMHACTPDGAKLRILKALGRVSDLELLVHIIVYVGDCSLQHLRDPTTAG